ncbi:MAG: response regulator, partial [Desulfovibrio sp.]|nr:response regulator [Desulfovibrio sp.]
MPEATPPQASESDIGVLLVDDSKVIRLSLAAMLGGRYRVREARNGRDAIAQYHLEKPDIMILDVNMPELDGFGVVDYVRNEVHDQETFILILTAEDDRTVRPRILSLGANDFLAKPCERVELLARTQVAARQMRLTRSLKASLNALAGELHTVGRLQRIMLPQASPFLKGLAVDSLYRPSGHASGDYFDYFPVGEDVLRLVVADVSGHGARAACLM